MSKQATEKVLAKLSSESLKKIAKVERMDIEEKSKKAIASQLVDNAHDSGVKILIAELSKMELEGIFSSELNLTLSGAIEPLNVDFGAEITNPKKVVLSKRLFEQISKLGVNKFLSSHAPNDIILRFAELLEVELDKKQKNLDDEDIKKEVVKQITDSVYFFGFRSLLENLDIPTLQDLAKEYGLKGTTNTKSKLIYALATQTNIKDLPSFNPSAAAATEEWMEQAAKAANKEKRPAIKNGVSYHDMYQLYLLEELVDWCRDNGLKVSGTKKEVINRILAYFDGDKENTMATVNNKKTDSKEAPAKKQKTEKKVSKKPAKVEKKPEPEKETSEVTSSLFEFSNFWKGSRRRSRRATRKGVSSQEQEDYQRKAKEA
jgi:hypothetical protein